MATLAVLSIPLLLIISHKKGPANTGLSPEEEARLNQALNAATDLGFFFMPTHVQEKGETTIFNGYKLFATSRESIPVTAIVDQHGVTWEVPESLPPLPPAQTKPPINHHLPLPPELEPKARPAQEKQPPQTHPK